MPIYICKEEQSNKHWQYEVQGLSVHVKWGRINGSGGSQTKHFGSSYEMNKFIDKKVREKESEGYKRVSDEELKKEVKIADALGTTKKIKRILWVDMQGKTLTQINNYDPKKWIYVEVMDSWSKEVTRLLLSRQETWEVRGSITETNRKIIISSRDSVMGEGVRFSNAVRQMLKELANTVTEAIKTIKFAAVGARNLFDDEPENSPAMEELSFKTGGIDRSVVSKFAALGQRTLEL